MAVFVMILYKRFIMSKFCVVQNICYMFIKLYTQATIKNLICTDATFNLC